MAECLCYNLRRAARAATRLYDEALRPSGLRATQFSLLGVLKARGPMKVTDLAEVAVTDRTTLTRNLRLLENERLVRIRPGEDRRVREVSVTTKGDRRLARAYPLWKEAQARLAAGLGEDRVGRLLAELSATIDVTRGE